MKERKNLIDGLPNSYNINYVLENKKRCVLCNKLIKEKQIADNSILCSESFDFYHKICLEKNEITYSHYNPKDKSTPVILSRNLVK